MSSMRNLLAATLLLALGACAATDGMEESPAPAAAPMGPVTIADNPGDPGVARAEGRTGSSSEDLSILRDPKFRRRFIESYAAETDVEPNLTAEEGKTMIKVLDLITADRLDEAAFLITEQQTPASSAVFDFTMANIYFQKESFDRAAESYRTAVEKFPKFRRAWAALSQIHYSRGEYPEAVEAFTRVFELGGGDALTYGLLGVCHSRLGDDISAESAYRMATMLDPATVDWKMGLADSFYKQGRFADAAALFGGLIKEQPGRADLWLAQGEAFARVGQPLKAAENFEMVDLLGKASVDTLSNLGDIYANEKLFEQAVGAYSRALRKDPEAKPDRAIRAATYLAANGALREVAMLVSTLEETHGGRLDDSQRTRLLHLRARMAVAKGATDEEARVLEEIVAIDPLDGEALILLGHHANRGGDKEKAVFYYERAANIEAFEAEAKRNHGQLLASEKRYKEALPLLRRSLELKPRQEVADYIERVERAAQISR
ncbi:MAG: tetratricopeptide repeat protein [Planctomycetota bacterium]